jgi:hypothetical protein
VEIPTAVSEIILDKEPNLRKYATMLIDGDCSFGAGFDVLPCDCWLILEEQSLMLEGTEFKV